MNISNSASLASNSLNLNSNLTKLSSGHRINSASDDASGLVIADSLSAQVKGLGQAMQNSNNAIGMVHVADGAMREYSDILSDVQELTLKAGSGILNSDNLASIQKEIDGLLSTASNIVQNTSYNGMKILSANNDFSFQVGANAGENIDIDFGDASSILPSVDVTNPESLQESLLNIQSSLKSAGKIMTDLGAGENALKSNMQNISVTQINTAAGESQIRDLDFAQESSDFNKNKLLDKIGIFAQAQRNISQENILSLLQ